MSVSVNLSPRDLRNIATTLEDLVAMRAGRDIRPGESYGTSKICIGDTTLWLDWSDDVGYTISEVE